MVSHFRLIVQLTDLCNNRCFHSSTQTYTITKEIHVVKKIFVLKWTNMDAPIPTYNVLLGFIIWLGLNIALLNILYHPKQSDILVITVISVFPMLCDNTALIGLLKLLIIDKGLFYNHLIGKQMNCCHLVVKRCSCRQFCCRFGSLAIQCF